MTTYNTNNETTMNTSTTTNNQGSSMFSSLPTTDFLYTLDSSLIGQKNIISNAHFVKVYLALPVSDFQHQRLMALCMEYNALTGDQQRAQNEAHLSAEDDFAIFTDEHGYTIIQHDPTFTTFKLKGFESVEMTTRRML